MLFGVEDPALVVVSSDCYDTDRIKAEEMRHVRVLEASYPNAQDAVVEFDSRRFGSENECFSACVEFAKSDLLAAIAPRWKHWWINLTHPARFCNGRRKL